MAIGYTELDFVNGSAPALSAENLNHIDEGVKACADQLDAQGTLTEAGRIDANAIAATAGATLAARLQTAANVEDGADVTDEANVTAAAVGTAEVTAAPAHWWVLVGGALKRMTQAGWTALVLTATGKTNAATGYTLAGGTTSKTLTVSADGDTKDIPTSAGKTAADAIGAATGADTGAKIKTLVGDASTTNKGVNLLAADGGTTAGTVVQANDSRLQSAPATWTPVVNFGGVADNGTSSLTKSKYTKSGKKIHIEAVIQWSVAGDKTGAVTITGVPASANAETFVCGMALIGAGGSSIDAPIFITMSGGVLYLVTQGSAGATSVTNAIFTATTNLRIVADYIAA